MTFYLYDTQEGGLYRVRAANRTKAHRKMADHMNVSLERAITRFDSFDSSQVAELRRYYIQRVCVVVVGFVYCVGLTVIGLVAAWLVMGLIGWMGL